jgi:hypothetical protein
MCPQESKDLGLAGFAPARARPGPEDLTLNTEDVGDNGVDVRTFGLLRFDPLREPIELARSLAQPPGRLGRGHDGFFRQVPEKPCAP